MTNSSTATRSPEQLKNKIQHRQARVGIIGLGYVGLPLALLFSEQEFAVTGFDIDQRKVDILAQGGSYIYRISAEEIRAAKRTCGGHRTATLLQSCVCRPGDACARCQGSAVQQCPEPTEAV